MKQPTQPMLDVRDLRKHFPIRGGILDRQISVVQAVDGISFSVERGETLGIVGESGCGKSTTARLLMQLVKPDAGEIRLNGARIGTNRAKGDITLREARRQMQMVFQDSYSSLNPRLPVDAAISFASEVHGMPKRQARERAHGLLAKVGLEPKVFGPRYPHELSGGQRQRVNIARALALHPNIVILDEAVSALDKSVEAQVLNLLGDIKQELDLTYLFISHDLNVVQYASDRVLVMYLGKVVEIGVVDEIYDNPVHPYTQALLSGMPSHDPSWRTQEVPLEGDPRNPIDPPKGCRFHTRCKLAENVCLQVEPVLAACDRSGRHLAACHVRNPASQPDGPTPSADPGEQR